MVGVISVSTSSFNLLDCKLFRGTLGITYELESAFEVDGWTSGISAEAASFGVVPLLDDEGAFDRVAGWGSVVAFASLFLLCC